MECAWHEGQGEQNQYASAEMMLTAFRFIVCVISLFSEREALAGTLSAKLKKKIDILSAFDAIGCFVFVAHWFLICHRWLIFEIKVKKSAAELQIYIEKQRENRRMCAWHHPCSFFRCLQPSLLPPPSLHACQLWHLNAVAAFSILLLESRVSSLCRIEGKYL